MSAKESWYKIVDQNEEPKQGDFIENCPVIIPKCDIKNNTLDATIKNYDVVILSQSCDIENGKLDFILLCPYWTLTQWEDTYQNFKDANLKENLRRGYLHSHCLLNKCILEEYSGVDDFFVVDFRSVYSIPISTMKEFIKKDTKNRLRLISPYREYLSQSFARFFMRVGLPENIPPFI